MKRINILLLALILTACGAPRTPAPLAADAPADNVPNIIGSYALNANDPTGEQYGGTLTIFAGNIPDQYKLQWLLSGDVQEGTGTLQGNQLIFTWQSVPGIDQSVSGKGIYTVTINGELHGDRFIAGVDTPGTETAYPNVKP